jgi:hypothetical protein
LPPCGRPFEPAGLDPNVGTLRDRTNLEALLEIEVLETCAAAPQIGAPLRQQMEPLRVERRFRMSDVPHASS